MVDWLQHLDSSCTSNLVGSALRRPVRCCRRLWCCGRWALIFRGVSHAGFGGIAVAMLVGYYVPALGNEVAIRVVSMRTIDRFRAVAAVH